MARKAIRPMMFVRRDMDKLKVEEEYGGNPAIDCRIGLDIRVSYHTSNELCVHLHN